MQYDCSRNAVGLQHMLQVQCMLQFRKDGISAIKYMHEYIHKASLS